MKAEGIVGLAYAGAKAAMQNEEYKLAGIFLKEALDGNGDSHYYEGSLASESVKADTAIQNEIRKNGQSVPVGETRPFFISADTSLPGNHYAFGNIKLVVDLTHNSDGSISATGYATDVYNFEYVGSESFGDFIATQAWNLQRGGLLHPYVYKIDFSTRVY